MGLLKCFGASPLLELPPVLAALLLLGMVLAAR